MPMLPLALYLSIAAYGRAYANSAVVQCRDMYLAQKGFWPDVQA